MEEQRQLLVNKIICPDGYILESRHRHDCRKHTTPDGKVYSVDGGITSPDIWVQGSDSAELLFLYYGDSHEELREHFSWGSYGKSGREELHYIKLKDITEEHLTALIDYVKDGPVTEIRMLFMDEESYRKERL